jgi:hypothetical protein
MSNKGRAVTYSSGFRGSPSQIGENTKKAAALQVNHPEFAARI